MSTEPTDAELAQAIARGDRTAETVLFERFNRRVLFLARRQLRSADLAEEARSETFLRALVAIREGRLRASGALAGFILQTTRNVVYEILRQHRRTTGLRDDNEDPATIAATGDEPPDPDLLDAVRDALADLAPRDRECLRLLYFDELPKEEIARRLHIDPERVRLVKSRALQRFRRAYERLGERPC